MADAAPVKVDPAIGRGFAWTAPNEARAKAIIAKYPAGRQQSAVMPLLDLAQRQFGEQNNCGGWLPVPVIEYVAGYLGMPAMRAYEVASFYTMYNLAPVGRHHVQVCGTTPCWLRGSDELFRAAKDMGLKKGQMTHDGLFTLSEAECLGACVNAPMMQINDDYFEDLTYDTTMEILRELAAGGQPRPGPRVDRNCAEPVGGRTTLKDPVE